MPRFQDLTRRLGKSGVGFIAALLLGFIFYAANLTGLLVFDVFALLILAVPVTFRLLRYIRRRSLWSVRNRLLVVYGLIGILPVALILLLLGLSAWTVLGELAIYLASSALDRKLEALDSSAHIVQRVPADSRLFATAEIVKSLEHQFPGVVFYLHDLNGNHTFPKDRPFLKLGQDWTETHGLLNREGRFYAWSHLTDSTGEITALSPLSDQVVAHLVPNLGEITLIEASEPPVSRSASPGSEKAIHLDFPGSRKKTDYYDLEPSTREIGHRMHIPEAVNRLDVELFTFAVLPHHDWDQPKSLHSGVMYVRSRPSAVLQSFFSGPEPIRGIVFDIIIGVGVLFLLVEMVALFFGVSLSRRITGAVNHLYEGTRRVSKGDFEHRIPVNTHDQLGDLAESFNQMTGTMQRLLKVEKEKERLETEIEIAREVQGQLYPKDAPPVCGLRLTAHCEPARMVSGDYYDYQDLSNGHVAFAIGDVAGKGISAALLMATIQAALRAQISHLDVKRDLTDEDCSPLPELDSAALVSKLNKQIYAHTSPEKYATFFFAFFDPKTCTLTYTNAGHLSPLLVRGSNVTLLDSNGTVVGAFPFAHYDSSCLTLEPDDMIVCYTDGITEPENAYGEMFGEERLIELVKKHSADEDREIVRIVMEAVRNWTGVPELSDDMTLLIARHLPVPPEITTDIAALEAVGV